MSHNFIDNIGYALLIVIHYSLCSLRERERERERDLFFILAFKEGLNLILKLTVWYLLWYDSLFMLFRLRFLSWKKNFFPQETSRRGVFLSSSLKWCNPTHLVGAEEENTPCIFCMYIPSHMGDTRTGCRVYYLVQNLHIFN